MTTFNVLSFLFISSGQIMMILLTSQICLRGFIDYITCKQTIQSDKVFGKYRNSRMQQHDNAAQSRYEEKICVTQI